MIRGYGHLACKVLRVALILVSELNGLLIHELVSRLYPNKNNKQKEHNQPRAMLKQHDAKHVMICGMRYAMHMHDLERND